MTVKQKIQVLSESFAPKKSYTTTKTDLDTARSARTADKDTLDKLLHHKSPIVRMAVAKRRHRDHLDYLLENERHPEVLETVAEYGDLKHANALLHYKKDGRVRDAAEYRIDQLNNAKK